MKIILFFVLLFTLHFSLKAQKVSVTLYGGAMNYQGDLQDKRFTFNQSHLSGGLGLNYELSDHFDIRSSAIFGKISGDDKFGRNKIRNLNFTTSIAEAQLGLQYYLTPLGYHSLTPYVFGSIAMFHFSPYTFDTNGVKTYLRPLSTEGQGFVAGRNTYKLSQFAIPFGGGVKLNLSDRINVGAEIGLRKLFTDYLDDVSTTYVDQNLLLANRGAKAVDLAYRGDELKDGSLIYPPAGTIRGGAKNKDWYYFSALTLTFKLGGGEGGNSRKYQYGCPVNVR